MWDVWSPLFVADSLDPGGGSADLVKSRYRWRGEARGVAVGNRAHEPTIPILQRHRHKVGGALSSFQFLLLAAIVGIR